MAASVRVVDPCRRPETFSQQNGAASDDNAPSTGAPRGAPCTRA
jgi:hypothetical protein